MLLLTTEDNFSGAWTSRLWYCRTYNRRELMALCESLRLALEERALVHADSSSDPRRRHLRRNRKDLTAAKQPARDTSGSAYRVRFRHALVGAAPTC